MLNATRMPNATRWGGRATLAALMMAGATAAPAAAQTGADDGAGRGCAPPPGPPQTRRPSMVQDFYDALFESMRHANEWHMQGRYDHLYPVMLKLFDVPAMTRIAVGPDFAKLGPDQQAALRDAFGRLLVATFASTFDDFKGETYAVDGDVATRGADRFVKSRFNGGGAPVDINFLLRGKGSDWRVVDIYLNGTISQLATWRSEYGSTFRDNGFDGLMAAVKAQTDKDMTAF